MKHFYVTIKQNFGAKPIFFTMTCRCDTADDANASAASVNDGIVGEFYPDLVALQSTGVTGNELYTYNLLDATDIDTLALTVAGQQSDAVNDRVTSIGFRSNRTRRDIRRSFHRVGGIGDGAFANNTLQSSYVSLAAAFATQMNNGFNAGTPFPAVHYTLTSVKRIFDSSIGEDGDYRLPVTSGELEFMDATDWSYSTNPRSQSSRKIAPAWVAP